MGGLIKTNVFNPVDWGVSFYNFRISNLDGTIETNINANAGEGMPKALYYLTSSHGSSVDATMFECGVIRLGYNGNHATKYKDSKSTTDLISVSVSAGGLLQITALTSIRTFISLYA